MSAPETRSRNSSVAWLTRPWTYFALNWLATRVKRRLLTPRRGRGGTAVDMGGISGQRSKRMSHLDALRLQVLFVVRIRFTANWDLFDHLDPVTFEADDFLGIVR